MRWAAGVEYLGTAYCGWQFQDEAPSVQQALERELSVVANHPVRVVAAGRTDAGVHAWQQVIHFDSPAPRQARAWLLGCNSLLPRDLALRWVQQVPPEFSARRSANSRRYRYVIHNGSARPGLLHDRVSWVIPALDEGRMNVAAQVLLGEHDFSAFRDAKCQAKSPMRNLHSIQVRRWTSYVVIDVAANAFLHHMVRNIAGTLCAVGSGERPLQWVEEVLRGRKRMLGGVTAAPEGLYFVGPSYPAEFGLPGPPDPPFPGPL